MASKWVEETIAVVTQHGWLAWERTWSMGESVWFATERFEDDVPGFKNSGYLYQSEGHWHVVAFPGREDFAFPTLESAKDFIREHLKKCSNEDRQ